MSRRPNGCGEDIAAYALGALEPEHARHFERHLRECELCRSDLGALRPAVDALGASAEPVEPPAHLKKQIMAIVDSEAKERRASEAPARRERRFGFRLLAPVAAAAAAVAVTLVLVTSASDSGSDAQRLAASVKPPGSTVELRLDEGRGTLVVEGVAAPVGGRVYQVWKKRGDAAPEPTDALCTTTIDGRASVAVPGGLDGVDQVLVSTEPRGGSRRPTTPVLVVVDT